MHSIGVDGSSIDSLVAWITKTLLSVEVVAVIAATEVDNCLEEPFCDWLRLFPNDNTEDTINESEDDGDDDKDPVITSA